ncbi:MAG: hypothetical protein V2A77_10815 [Pseudomonadota bacterium]
MPAIEIPLTLCDLQLDFRVIYSVEPLIHRTETSPEEGGILLDAVVCVAARFDGGRPFPQETLDALRETLIKAFWRHHTHREPAFAQFQK